MLQLAFKKYVYSTTRRCDQSSPLHFYKRRICYKNKTETNLATPPSMTAFCMLRLTVFWVLFLPDRAKPVNAKLTLGVVQQETTYHRMLKSGKKTKKPNQSTGKGKAEQKSTEKKASKSPSSVPSLQQQKYKLKKSSKSPSSARSLHLIDSDASSQPTTEKKKLPTFMPSQASSFFVTPTAISAPTMAPMIPPTVPWFQPLTLFHPPPPLQAAPAAIQLSLLLWVMGKTMKTVFRFWLVEPFSWFSSHTFLCMYYTVWK
jgi:hypothetical protein